MFTKLVLATLSLSAIATAATIGFSPVSQNINVGDVTSVDIAVSSLANNQVIGAFDLTVLYNPTILTAQSILLLGTLGPIGDNFTDTSIATAGQASAAVVSFASNPALAALQLTQPFSIFRITFLGFAPGTSALTFANSPRILSDGNGNTITSLIVNTGSITVLGGGGGGDVPEPSTWILLSSSCFALLAFRRIQKN